MVQIVDLETYSDADFSRRYTYRTSGGVPIDLGTDILRMMVRSHPEDVTVAIDRSSIDSARTGILITNAAAGEFTLMIPASILVRLMPGIYVHSLIRTDASFQARQDIWRGTLTHNAGPTRWTTGTFRP